MSFKYASLLLCASVGLAACDGDTQTTTDSGTDVPVVNDVQGSDVQANDVQSAPDVQAADVPAVAQSFVATLSGRQEVPAVYDTAATGTATFTLSADRTSLQYMITHSILLPTGAHIHLGIAGENGAVAVPFTATPAVITGTTPVTADQATAIEEGRAYVNIHTAAHAGGEIRGQIVRPNEQVYVAALSTDQENPPTTGTGTGLGEFLVDPTALRVRYVVRTTGLSGAPSAAHIHTGAAGTNGGVAIDFGAASMNIVGTRPITSVADLEGGRWYANVHTAANPAGEVRGQILRPGEVLYIGRMTGAQEVPPVTTTSTGSTAVIVSADRDRLTYDGAVTGFAPTMAHLHTGAAGASGGVVVTFDVTGMTFRGTNMPGVGSTLLGDLAAGNIYANAHSAANPGGEVRGQMRRAPATP